MKILFLTIDYLEHIAAPGLYTDLLRTLKEHGHEVHAVSVYEKRKHKDTAYSVEDNVQVLRVRIGNITKCGLIEKGISTLRIKSQYLRAIRRFFGDARFDLILYSTPPITLAGVVNYIKKRDNARTYLLLKDIFPQNAVDIGMMSPHGVKGLLYRYFRKKEKQLYAVSDRIGCMSPANCEYVLTHNPEISPERVEVCPNSIEPRDLSLAPEERIAMRDRYGIPRDKKVFAYGGNLGKPQGIPFVIECLKREADRTDALFLIVGDGTEYSKLEAYVRECGQKNVKLMKRLPKEDYDRMIAACDVGLIFLDHRFTIPNFPSRLLSYMQAGLPVLACTDPHTDVGKVIEDGGFGLWCESNDAEAFHQAVSFLAQTDTVRMGRLGYEYLLKHYDVKEACQVIMRMT